MAVVYHEIYLPIDTESTFDYIVIKQGDAGTHRVRATLISNNRVYTIPTSGASYFMKFRKPDNNYCLVEATVSDNTISAEVTEEMLRVSGTGRGEFMIVSGSDELKTATFHVKIVKETFTSGDVQSHSDFAPFAVLLQGAGAAASNANTAAAAANAAASLAEQKAQAIPDDYSDLVAEVEEVKADLDALTISDIDNSADFNLNLNRAFLKQMDNQETVYKLLLNSLYDTNNASAFLGGDFNMFNLIENEYTVEKGKALDYREDGVHEFLLVKIANQISESILRKRGLIYAKNNNAPTIINADNTTSAIRPIRIPAGSTLMYSRNAKELGLAIIPAIMKYDDSTGLYHRVIGYTWHISNIDGNAPHIFDLKPYNDGNHYLAMACRTADYEQMLSSRDEGMAKSGEKTTSHNTNLDITDSMIATLNITII